LYARHWVKFLVSNKERKTERVRGGEGKKRREGGCRGKDGGEGWGEGQADSKEHMEMKKPRPGKKKFLRWTDLHYLILRYT
jgi:hypothetical protein